ncbi:MAG TPA: protein-L-isoaspartate O-methyltransferase [Candidatus Norongarragalinales archaeon]|nr:protein-L-isoaspartate O-methyltransferase [Candidatus Norongarragalinales archaeon]
MTKAQLELLIKKSGVSPSIAHAFEKVDRADFVPPQSKGEAYEDRPIPLHEGQTTSQPSLIAFILEKLRLEKGHRVLEVGTGFGFQTALLSELVGKKGFVVSIEFFGRIYEEAFSRLKGRKNVLLVQGDGKNGFAEKAPFDAIVVSAACASTPKTLFSQLKEGGRMVFPLQKALFAQDLVLVEKKKGKALETVLLPVAFVPLR